MAEQPVSGLTPKLLDTPEHWIKVVIQEFDLFLKDHASCEKKASGMAISMASHYPDRPRLLNAMIDLAVEELNHYREAVRILIGRDQQPGPDTKDHFVLELNKLVRKGKEYFLLDRLLIAALVERRGAERFRIISQHVREPTLKKFYTSITESEDRHWRLFLNLANEYFSEEEITDQFFLLASKENKIMQGLPIKPALH